ncbi:MAG TPA: UDP-3-O-(3-hydroxymyristoyl)glucosamine N-acyltransferase [Chitinophagaceae bacterium]|jgi:UDP-3-O-[3-hydroxymyristoyl] glucosamine N-acyltransferase|nr:UDP-3-O-(3-hydroxymyristoyl)glucosamine N-acyltransferase [Chitinophagaceae bacterium]
MQFTAAQISLLLNGKVEGNADTLVTSFGKIEEAQPDQLTFFANPKYEDFLYSTQASIVILNDQYELKQPVTPTLIRVADAYTAFAQLLSKYQEMATQQLRGIQQPSHIPASVKLGRDVYIGAFTYLGDNVKVGDNTKIFPNTYIGDNVQIGAGCVIHPGVKIYFGCILGSNVVIHAGTIIGSDGFGFAPQADGSFKKVPQIGNVVIEDNVEVGANTSIDRATMGSTIIRSGAKLDNLIQIAHNVEVGQNTVIAAQAGVSGSTKIGANVMIGGQAGLVGHIQIADGAKINAQSGVSKSLKTPNSAVTGSPAYDYTSALRSQAVFRNLPEMEKRIQELEELVKQLLAEKAL